MPKKSKPTGKALKTSGEPKFPYTTKPSSLRRLLQDIPKKPKPPKFDKQLLQSWGYSDSNDYSMIRVLKSVGLIGAGNQPTDLYAQYMNLQDGAGALGGPLKKLYEPLFNASHRPFADTAEALQNLFNIHSGGSDRVLEQQIQTFKALCENASFDSAAPPSGGTPVRANGAPGIGQQGETGDRSLAPAININVHIHLPENKTRRDYECMIEDIGRHIFGRATSGEPRNES